MHPVSKLPIPSVGQGTWQMERDDRREAIAALRRGLDLGLNHIDTAEMYGSGEVERLVGEAIAGRRDEVFLASKVLPSHASYEGTIAACEASLARLGTDRLDLYMLHWPGTHPLEETFRAFAKLLEDGKILRFGVSNFDEKELEAAIAITGPGVLACNQVLYHLQERAIEHVVMPWCQRNDVPVVAYSPFGSGRFPSPASAGGRALAAVAERHETTVYAVALARLAAQSGTWVIPKASRVSHVEDNARARELELTDEDCAELDTAFPRGRRRALPFL